MTPAPGARELAVLLRDIAIGLATALLAIIVLSFVGMHLQPILPLSLAVLGATGLWFLRRGISRADAADHPELDLDPDAARPDARDVLVRKMEAAAYSAQPSRKITGRAVSQILARIAEEREHREDVPPLSEGLRRLIAESQQGDHDAHPIGPIDRAALHRHLRELAAVPTPPKAPPATEEIPA
ncbi:hypothetical protein [Brachybacterium hainanense]|uniref:Uncharacterized protein n=1 Tax=Brachybacterium hainanense TaxID=1541174 RepID=A0ABV6RER4_9MICO